MNRQKYKKSYELKNIAKDKLDGKYGPAVFICFVSFAIQTAVTMFIGMLLPDPALSTGLSVPLYIAREIFALALSCVFGVFRLGLNLFFLNVACGRQYGMNDLFYGFKNDSPKALTISGVYALLGAVCQLPGQYLLTAFFLTGKYTFITSAAIAELIGLCIYLPVSAGLFLSYYLILDFPDKTAKEILALSFRLMKGNKRRVLYLICSFIPLMMLCVCTIYIGFLWLMPYIRMTYACFFLDLMNPNETAQN